MISLMLLSCRQILVALFVTVALVSADDRQIRVRIVNDTTSSPVQIYSQIGADFRATPRNFRSYQTLEPGQSISIRSDAGQTWLAFDARTRRAVGMVKASFRQRSLTVTDRDIRAVQGRSYRAKFHNRTGRTVAVYLSLGARQLPHSTIAPGRVQTQEIWGNQIWEFRDYETGRPLRTFTAPRSNADVVIESRRGGGRIPYSFRDREPEMAQELLIDNRTSRPALFWFDGQRSKRRINGYEFEVLPASNKSPWFLADRATGRYIACGDRIPSNRRIVITDEDCAPAFAKSVELTLRNYHDEPAYAYPMLGRDALPGIVLAAGELRRVSSYEGQRWEFRSSDRSRKLGSYQCSADEPSAAIGRPRFQRYRGKVDFTIENRRRRGVNVSVDHGDHVDLIETVPPLTRAVIPLDAGEQVILTDHRTKEILDTARVTLRDPAVVIYSDADPVDRHADQRDHRAPSERDARAERPRTLSDLLGDLLNRRR